MARRAARPRRRDIFPIGFTPGGTPPPDPPVITSSLTASGTVGVAFSYTITATNSPTSFNATGLPDGLSVNTGTGAITGTPTGAATSNITISATNAGGTDTETLVLTVSAASGATLSSASAVFSDVFAWLKVTTDTGSGTLYGVVCPAAASVPSGAQIEAGQDGSGAAATANANVAIASSGAKTLYIRPFVAATAYKIYATHKTGGSTYSNVVSVTFTSDVLIVERGVVGTAPGTGVSTGCAAFSGANLSRNDPYGGTNASRFMDVNDATSGAVIMTMSTVNYFLGINKFFFTFKYTSGAPWMRLSTSNVLPSANTHWNISTNAIGTNLGTINREAFDLGSGWFMKTFQVDFTGSGDLAGGYNFSKGATDNSVSPGTRDGSHQADFFNLRITRAGP